MDINKIFSQLGQMKGDLEKMISSSKEDLSKIKHRAKSGDDGIEVEVVIDGNKKIDSIKFSEGLKKYISDDPEGFWDILSDLIITAFNKAAAEADNENDATGMGNMDMSDIMKTVGNMPGMGDISKLLGGAPDKKSKK